MSAVLELDALLAFTGPEVVAMICGEQAAWDAAELRAMIRPGYGYTQESAPIAWLREFLCDAGPPLLLCLTCFLACPTRSL